MFEMSLLDKLCSKYKSVPEPENLFKVDLKLPKVGAKLKDECYAVRAKYLCFSQRSRTNI